MLEPESKRTIEEVLDLETGELILSEEFFKQPEDRLIHFRRRLQEAINKIAKPKYVCPYCLQLLKISGMKTQRGVVSYFAHLYDSEDCEIKTNGNYSQEEIEIIKYSSFKESQRHIDLKDRLCKALTDEKSKHISIKNVEVEKRFKSENPLLNWRRPDVYAEYGGKKIVFELQLSTTFLSVIVARDIFYKLNKTFIIWVFNFSANTEYVNLSNLMCKDIYYANKRNAFVFDEEAMKMSEAEKELVLLCIWFEPIIENGKIVPGTGTRHQKYIKLSDLSFDEIEFKPFYIDADKLFLKYEPEQLIERIRKEKESEEWLKNVEENILKRLNKKEIEREGKEKEKKDKIEEIKNGIKEGVFNLTPHKKGGKWGYESQSEWIIIPTYNFASSFDSSGFAKVKRNRKFGFINKLGEEVIPCSYDEVFEIYKGRCIVREGKEWFCVDSQNNLVHALNYEEVSLFQEDLNLIKITRIETIRKYAGNNGRYNIYKSYHSYFIGIMNFAGEILIPPNYSEISPFVDGTAKAIVETTEGILEYDSVEIKAFIYSVMEFGENEIAKAKKNGLIGFVNRTHTEIIPCIYDSIEPFHDNLAKAKRNNLLGYIDQNGYEIIPCIYETIEHFRDNKAKAKRNNLWGYIDSNGNEIISCNFNIIEDFQDNIAKAKRNNLWGYIDQNGNETISCSFDTIEQFQDDRAKARRNNLWGYIDQNGSEVISCNFDAIEAFENNKSKAKKNGLWGYLEPLGSIIINFIYQAIEDNKNGFYKIKKNDKWGYIDYSGKLVVKNIYDELGDFYNGFTTIRLKDGSTKVHGLARYVFSNKRGYVDKTGKEYWQHWKDERDTKFNFTNRRY